MNIRYHTEGKFRRSFIPVTSSSLVFRLTKRGRYVNHLVVSNLGK